jgi:carboxypeptidase Q
MQDAHLEKWDFTYPGWTCDKYAVRVLSPFQSTLGVRVVAWTPSTRGVVRAKAVQIDLPGQLSQEDLTKYLNSINKEKIHGKIVLVGAHTTVPISFNASAKRREEAELRRQFDPDYLQPAPRQALEPPVDGPTPLELREIDKKIDAFLRDGGALVKVMDAARDHGQIRVFANRAYTTSSTIPSIVLRNEDYGRICRVLADDTSVEMEVEISNTIHSDEPDSFNVIAEIPGTDKKDQVVMIGAHIDSWHAGTGATDNAAGVAVMMEAARILQQLEVKPRRTIRVALWGGEEQGLLGSKAYIKKHFGTFESPGEEYSNLAAYLNLDSGTGRVRGASIFGPPEAAALLRKILAPFQDLGVIGVESVKLRSYGGTDSTSFNWAGLPGINLMQDPIEYFTHTWHTDLDTYERVLEGDLKQCVIVAASAAYHLAMIEERLPRFTGDSMPAPEK